MLTSRELAALVGGELHGDGDLPIDDVAPLNEAGRRHLVFVEGRESVRQLAGMTVGAVLLPGSQIESVKCDAALIVVNDPLEAFVSAMLHFRPVDGPEPVGISAHAHVSASATFGENCHVYPGATVSDRVVCGRCCVILPGAYIGPACRLGDEVTVYPNSVLYGSVVIGNRVTIHATAVVGGDGFGYRFSQGRFHKIPHTGTVLIEDDVEIGAGTTIDRAMIGATVIGAGTKLDNQVMIAHNCRIGKHNAFASQVGLAGSTTSGDYVRCGGQVGVADHSHLGTGCSIGAKAGLFGTVPDGAEYHGFPAGPAKEQYRIAMTVQKLPEMRQQLKQLEAEVKRLQSRLPSVLDEGADDDRSQIPAAA